MNNKNEAAPAATAAPAALAGLHQDFLENVSRVSRGLRTLFDNRTRSTGLTLARARALLQLSQQDISSQTELAALLGIEGPTLVRLLDGLQRQGLIERQARGRDRRVNQIALTAKGSMVADEIRAISASIQAELLCEMTPEDLARCSRAMERLTVRLKAISGADAPAGAEPAGRAAKQDPD